MLGQLVDPVIKICVKLAKCLLYTMLAGIVFFLCTVVYAYVEGYMITRAALNIILEYAADENCLAAEQIYYNSNGEQVSIQDGIRDILEAYEDAHWYLEFDTQGNFVGGTEDYPVCIYYTDSSGNRIAATSYETVPQRGTVLHVALRSQINVVAWTAPTTWTGAKKEPGSRGTEVHLPMQVASEVVGTREYKGLDLIRGR